MIIFDGHIDTLLQMLHSGKNLSDSEGHVSLEKLIEGRVSAQIFAVFVEPVFCQGMALHRGLEMIDLFWGMLAENPEALGFAGSGQRGTGPSQTG